MVIGAWQTGTIAKSETTSSAVDLGRPYETLLLALPELDSTTIAVQGSETSGGTYTNLYVTDPADGGNNQLISAATTGRLAWVVPIGGFQYIKIVAGYAQPGGARTLRHCGVRR